MFFDSITKNRPIIKTHCCKKIQKCVFFWCNVCDFLNLSIFVREYRTRRPGIPHLNEIYVTKPQTSHNNMQKTRPRYHNLEGFFFYLLRISIDTSKKTTLYYSEYKKRDYDKNKILPELMTCMSILESKYDTFPVVANVDIYWWCV